jgi:hypothetical protein
MCTVDSDKIPFRVGFEPVTIYAVACTHQLNYTLPLLFLGHELALVAHNTISSWCVRLEVRETAREAVKCATHCPGDSCS